MTSFEDWKPIQDINDCPYRQVHCENMDNTEICNENCLMMKHFDYMLQMSELPRFRRQRVDLDKSELTENARNYIDNALVDILWFAEQGHQLCIRGKAGTGKTAWACKFIVNYLAVSGKTYYDGSLHTRAIYIHWPEFVHNYKRYIAFQYQWEKFIEQLQTINQCSLVVWDNIDISNMPKFDEQLFEQYVIGRQQQQRCNIIIIRNYNYIDLDDTTTDTSNLSQIVHDFIMNDCEHLVLTDKNYYKDSFYRKQLQEFKVNTNEDNNERIC